MQGCTLTKKDITQMPLALYNNHVIELTYKEWCFLEVLEVVFSISLV